MSQRPYACAFRSLLSACSLPDAEVVRALNTLGAHEDLRQRSLVEQILRARPQLLAPYLASMPSAWEPRASFRFHTATACPSGLRGQTQVLLAQAAWVQIPLLSCRVSARRCAIVAAVVTEAVCAGCHCIGGSPQLWCQTIGGPPEQRCQTIGGAPSGVARVWVARRSGGARPLVAR